MIDAILFTAMGAGIVACLLAIAIIVGKVIKINSSDDKEE